MADSKSLRPSQVVEFGRCTQIVGGARSVSGVL